MKLREKVARAIAHAKTGLDPDTRTAPFQPPQMWDGNHVVPPEDSLAPLWTRYLGAADAALQAVCEALPNMGEVAPDNESP